MHVKMNYDKDCAPMHYREKGVYFLQHFHTFSPLFFLQCQNMKILTVDNSTKLQFDIYNFNSYQEHGLLTDA